MTKDEIHETLKSKYLKGVKKVNINGKETVIEYVRSLHHENGDVMDEELDSYIYQVKCWMKDFLGMNPRPKVKQE
jgi:hypothetical protein